MCESESGEERVRKRVREREREREEKSERERKGRRAISEGGRKDSRKELDWDTMRINQQPSCPVVVQITLSPLLLLLLLLLL